MAEVIVALDLPSPEDALRLVDQIPDLKWVKVGSAIQPWIGPDFCRELCDRGLEVFLDLKWHDIPNTVSAAVAAASQLGVSLATLHILGGTEMIEAATAAAGPMALVGITVLTSHSSSSFGATTGRDAPNLIAEVVRLAELGHTAGLAGVVCSPREIEAVRAVLGPQAWIVAPGIRQAHDHPGDQERTATPAEAARAGATHLVVGRPITQSSDPGMAFRQIAEEAQC